MDSNQSVALTDKEIRQYWEDGFLVFDGVIGEEEVEVLRESCESPQITALRTQKDFETKTVHALGITSLHPAFLHVARHPAIIEKIKPLLGPDIALQHSKLATKPPVRGIGPFPWHQDYAFYPHTNMDLLSVMVMLDDAAPENGCMQMVRASHKLGVLCHEDDNGFRGECQESGYWQDESQIEDIMPKAGGISIHHALTLHGSGPNLSGEPRRGLVFSYRAADAYQLADMVFDDTGLIVCGQRSKVVRCDAGIVPVPYRGGEPFGSAYRQIGPFAEQMNR